MTLILMRITAVLFLLVLTACPHARPIYNYEGESPTPSPVVSHALPTPKPTAAPLPPFPLVLQPTAGLRVYANLTALVEAGCARWNGALGDTVFLQAGTGRPIVLDLMNEYKSFDGFAVGQVDDLDDPHHMWLWPGTLPPDDKVVVLHELGHLLGVTHSDKSEDVMYPQNGFCSDLTSNDIQRGKAAVAYRRQRATP